MSYTAYIAPTDLLETAPPRSGWHATQSAVDPTQSLLLVDWENPNGIDDFEAQPGVILLGLPWETVPAEAVSLLALFQDGAATTDATPTPSIPSVAPPPAPTQPVSTALRAIAWPGARLFR